MDFRDIPAIGGGLKLLCSGPRTDVPVLTRTGT
jgi:hypothetical protein